MPFFRTVIYTAPALAAGCRRGNLPPADFAHDVIAVVRDTWLAGPIHVWRWQR